MEDEEKKEKTKKTPPSPFYHPLLSAIGGRKFFALILIMVSQPILLVLGHLPPDSYTIIITGVAGTYITGNAIASLADARSGRSASFSRKVVLEEHDGELGDNPSSDYQTR